MRNFKLSLRCQSLLTLVHHECGSRGKTNEEIMSTMKMSVRDDFNNNVHLCTGGPCKYINTYCLFSFIYKFYFLFTTLKFLRKFNGIFKHFNINRFYQKDDYLIEQEQYKLIHKKYAFSKKGKLHLIVFLNGMCQDISIILMNNKVF